MLKILIASLLSGCMFTVSAVDTIPSKTAYCEPLHPDVYICREDYGRTYRCVNNHGYWKCEEV